jgi:hypothetical protein
MAASLFPPGIVAGLLAEEAFTDARGRPFPAVQRWFGEWSASPPADPAG